MKLNQQFSHVYKDTTVLITGHTGFKGSWLALWLHHLGAKVHGFSDTVPTNPSHFELLKLNITHHLGDINQPQILQDVISQIKPKIIFHLAAQPLVRRSYIEPHHTYATNVMGTLNVLQAARNCPSIRAIVCATTDKCYENKNWVWGYRETDTLGGHDPYSSSKACAELLISSFRESFFSLRDYGQKHHCLIAAARAGNVIGGGDWAEDRLIPDIIRAVTQKNKVSIRNPNATRPWQHVLDPLRGYLMLGEKLLLGLPEFSGAWNFGPNEDANITVEQAVMKMCSYWSDIKFEVTPPKNDFHEAKLLMLDCSKAKKELSWNPIWDVEQSFLHTTNWYKHFYQSQKVISINDIIDFDSKNK